jgi:hypothetical protein
MATENIKMMRLIISAGVFLASAIPAFAEENIIGHDPAAVPGVWYEGGTLQKATVEEWKRATAENQLATAADFSASMSNIPDISATTAVQQAEIKKSAVELRGCVNESIATEPDLPSDRDVAQLVVMCTILKKKDE